MPVRQLFQRLASHVFCYHVDQDDHSGTQPSSMRELEPASPDSVFPPSSTNRHNRAVDLAMADRQALDDIFSSSSSVRGYRAANTTAMAGRTLSNSLDESPLAHRSPTKKTSRRLDQLGHNIRKRISESRLSKSSSKIGVGQDRAAHSPSGLGRKQDEGSLLGTTHRSTGLSDILMSRAASEGGYDSDAKSVQLAGIKSTNSTVRRSPEQANMAVDNVALSLRKEIVGPAEIHMPPQISESTSTYSYHQSMPSSPARDPVEDLSRVGSPKHTVNPIKTSQANGTESLHPAHADQTDARDYERDRSAISVNLKTLDYIGTIDQKPSRGQPLSPRSKTPPMDNANESGTTARAAASIDKSDNDSVHLFNMRISQRLASTSQIPVLATSYPTSIASSTDERPDSGQPRSYRSSMARFPSWIAQEHNRRPSDPQTKRLFEGHPDQNKLHTKWKSITSMGSNPAPGSVPRSREDASSFYWSDGELPGSSAGSTANVTKPRSLKNQNSIAIGGRSASLTLPLASASRLSNADGDSWAGSRSAGLERKSVDSSSLLASSVLGNDTRGRSTPKESRFAEVLSMPALRLKQPSSSVEATEGTSQSVLDDMRDRRNEALSEISVEQAADVRRETFSEVDPHSLEIPQGLAKGRKISIGWLSQGRRSGWGFDFIDRSPSRQRHGDASIPGSEHELQESATNMWERALRRARGKESVSESSFLGLPQFDRTGRRRRSSTKIENAESLRERAEDHEKSTSAKDEASSLIDNHQQICLVAQEPLTGPVSKPEVVEKSVARLESQNQGERVRKKSLLDLGRLNTISASISHHDSGSTTPVKEFLSWTRFPSHARAQRIGTAGGDDGVNTQDFERGVDEESILNNVSTTNLGLHTPGSRFESLKNVFLSKNSSRSTMDAKPKYGSIPRVMPRRKLTGRLGWKKLYHSVSSDLRKDAEEHKSSVSIERYGVDVLQGRAANKTINAGEHRKSQDTRSMSMRRSASWDGDLRMQEWSARYGHEASKRDVCHPSLKSRRASHAQSRPSAELLAQQYQDVVHAPLPTTTISSGVPSDRARHVLVPERKGSRRVGTETDTVAFREELHRRQAANKARLLRRVEGVALERHSRVSDEVGGVDEEDIRDQADPPEIGTAQCEIGRSLGTEGSCEDVTGRSQGGVDGA